MSTLLATTQAALARLNADELEMAARFIAKIEGGTDKHGHLDLATDSRDFLAEWEAEQVDAAAYAIMLLIRSRRYGGERARPSDAVRDALAELRDAEITAPRDRFDVSDAPEVSP